MISLRKLGADDWRSWRELRLQALAEAPDAFGTKLHEWLNKGDTEARWRERLRSVPFNIIANLDGKPAGMVSATVPDAGRIELISMWVAPFARGRGVGDALVKPVIQWSKDQNARYVTADVKENNLHAIALYARHGFAFSDDRAAAEPGERTMVRDISG